ncbi:uncharacterized protein LOC142546827 [Primulina tabacum]|uniref:uncharacterized protein LOC142546827 n=1 Tax=Primulina tabacum TaxID=48773 RepID=UPI003F5AA793
MDPSHYLQQQAFDPSAYQIDAYDPSAAGYYAYSYPQYGSDVQQRYLYYNYSVQPQHQEVHQELKPPGVSVPSQQAQMYYYHQYYQHAAAVNVDPHHGGVGAGVAGSIPAEQMIAQPSYGDIGGIDGRPRHGGTRSHSGRTPSVVRRPFRGRGRDRGCTPHVPPKNAPAHAHNQITAAPVLPPPKVAWCELCKVDCNTPEILETHRQGKKHLKNVKVHEELQNRNKRLIQEQMPQASGSELGPEVPPRSNPVLGYGEMKLHPETLSDRPVDEESGKRKVEDVEPSVGPAKKPRMDRSAGRGRGLRNKIRGGKGGDRMRSHHESGIPAEPRKPKEVIPLICELCNIKCDTAAVFQCHLTGKKHLSKAKSFLRQNKILGQEVLKALSPAILALLQNAATASTSIAPQLHHQGFVPFQGASGLDANGCNFYAPTSGINPESADSEAMNQPLSFSTNSGTGNLVHADGNKNEGHSESGAENAYPAPVSLAVGQAERVAACTAFATSGTAMDVGSIFAHRANGPPSDQNAHPGSDALASQVRSKGEESA